MVQSGLRTPAAVLVLSAALAACGGQHLQTNQAKLCVFGNNQEATACHEGELAYFSPHSWGNAQLPLSIIATYCNTNQPVHFNQGGVICTFTRKRLWLLHQGPQTQL